MAVAATRRWELNAQLLLAIQNSDVTKASKLFHDGVDTDTRFAINSLKRPAICLSVENNDLHMVQMMLQLGVGVNQNDSEGKTPLHIACQYGYLDLTKLLLESRADPHAKNEIGQTPLHLTATKMGKQEIVQLLSYFGANLDEPDNNHLAPLHLAAQSGNSEVVIALLEAGANPEVLDTRGNAALHFAVDYIGTDVRGISALSKSFPRAALLVNCYGKTPLHILVAAGRNDSVEALKIILREVPFSQLSSPSAAISPRTERGHTPLHLAVLERNISLARILVASGSQVDTRDQLGRTPLDCAVRDADMEIAALLLAAGASTRRLVNEDGVLPHVKDQHIKEMLLYVTSGPLSLASLCRRSITTRLGPPFQGYLEKLPKIWRDFLAYEEL